MPGQRTIWRWAAFVVLLIAIVTALIFGNWPAFWSLALLLAAYLAADRIRVVFSRSSTPARLCLAVVVLVVFWWVLFRGLVPAIPLLAADYPEVAPIQQVARVLAPLYEMDGNRRIYLGVAISLPLLIFVFGVGPFSQHGLTPARPTVAALGGADEED